MKKICMLSTVHRSNDVRIFYKEAVSLSQSGFQVVLLIHDDSGDRVDRGVYLKAIGPSPKRKSDRLPSLFKIYKMALAEKADAYHFHDPELLPVGFLLRMRTRRPVIYDSHENYAATAFARDWIPDRIKSWVSFVVNKAEVFISRRLTVVITVVEDQDARFRRSHCKTLPIYNYPILAFFPDPVKPWEDRPIHAAYVGGLSMARGVRTLLGIAKKIKTIIPDFRMLLIGPFSDPFVEKEALAQIRRNQLEETIIYDGVLPSESIGQRLQQVKLGLIPFEKNPKFEKMFIPTKLLEYMASGMPIIASDFPSNRLFIEKYSLGKLVPPGDVDAFVEAIVHQLRDREGSIEISKRGVEIARKSYRWENEAAKLIHFYQNVLN
ncbi:MAG: glycosyltransferase family 4 protein [Calditrichaeota bacterium]|nr:glycosyltransferase family 4 protein [Calditrichota bacterium]